MFRSISKLLLTRIIRNLHKVQIKKCHSVFGLKDLLQQDKTENFIISQVTTAEHQLALDAIKTHYLPEHVLVKAKNMDISDDCAMNEYLVGLLKQGNTLYAKTEDNKVAGICVGYACSQIDTNNLRNYAFYRQDPNTKDFLYFTAKLQETPNLWNVFKQRKIYEIKMLAVAPEYRRQGLGVALVENAKEQAYDQGYNVVRMDCVNSNDFKVAERCMFKCIIKFPLHKLRGSNAPFIKRSSSYNRYLRVYVDTRALPEAPDMSCLREKREDFEKIIE